MGPLVPLSGMRRSSGALPQHKRGCCVPGTQLAADEAEREAWRTQDGRDRSRRRRRSFLELLAFEPVLNVMAFSQGANTRIAFDIGVLSRA